MRKRSGLAAEPRRIGVPVSPATLRDRLSRLPHVEAVRRALGAEGVTSAWLVGGALRDLAAGIEPDTIDIDVALPCDGAGAAKHVARDLGGSAFPLDEAQGAWRVVLRGGDTVDFVPLRAPDLSADLAGRDFTINALALDLLKDGELFDPTGGLMDLRGGRLRPCSARSLEDDPIRVLRAYRFSFALALDLSADLPPLLASAARRLGDCAPERVRTELFAVLGLPGGSRAFRAMAEHGVLHALFPFTAAWPGLDQGDYHCHDLLEHSFRSAEAVDDLAADPERFPRPQQLEMHLREELEAGITRRALLVCAAFLHDIAKPDTLTLDGTRRRFLTHENRGAQQIANLLESLRVGKKARAAAQRMVAAHLRLFQLAHQDPPTRRARLKYLKDLRQEVPEAILLSLADEVATGPEPPCLEALQRTAREVLELYWERRQAREIPPLLRGRDLLEHLGLSEGPRIGKILRSVEGAERRGEISSRGEALALAREMVEAFERGAGKSAE